jgi:hypothetical protein
MSPAAKVVVKCVLFGAGALLSGIATAVVPDNHLSLAEGLVALSGSWGVALTYAGIGYVTPLEATGK